MQEVFGYTEEDFIELLYSAYRKAKADVFYESAQPFAIEFRDYELNLDDNLRALATQLKDGRWSEDIEFIGGYCCIPKGGLRFESRAEDSNNPTVSISDPRSHWEELCDGHELSVQFRPIAQFSVNMYVVCALWVNLVGQKFDACLGKAAYGSRVRRYRSKGNTIGKYHNTAHGTFEPYFYRYHDWRSHGLKAIRTELSADHSVVAMTMDVTSFYHCIDASFLLNERYQKSIEFESKNGAPISEHEHAFTEKLVRAFQVWAEQLSEESQKPPGVPVGPSAARIIANVLLCEFDKQLQEELSPVYYGRYVDDIFLVMRNNGQFQRAEDVINWMVKRIPVLQHNKEGSGLRLVLDYDCTTDLSFKNEKQRIFMLSGETGHDLLDAIENQISDVSSEHRMLPELDTLTRTPAAKVLTASKKSTEDADSLRKADGLSLKRMGFALMLRSADKFARDLPASEWREERFGFYDFVKRHVLTPSRFLEQCDYLPRLISLAIHCKDWAASIDLLNDTRNVIREIEENVSVLNGDDGDYFNQFKKFVGIALREAIAKSVPVEMLGRPRTTQLIQAIIEKVDFIEDDFWLSFLNDYAQISKDLFIQDLARRPLKEAILNDELKIPRLAKQMKKSRLPAKQRRRAEVIRKFLRANRKAWARSNKIKDIGGLLFPTRPLHPAEITDCVPRCNVDIRLWGEFVRAIRGAWVRPNIPELIKEEVRVEGQNQPLIIGGKQRHRAVRIAIPSVLVEEHSWAAAADGKPDESKQRYNRLVRLARGIAQTPRRHRPHYVVFPELSIPWRFKSTLVNHFLGQRISVIAGMEYRPGQKPHHLINEAKLFLTDDRLGFDSWSVFTQQKKVPAPGEKLALRKMFDKEFAPSTALSNKWIVRHFGFDFGVLICSELTNISYRQNLRGKVDCLFTLAWNRDLESFSSLVESAAIDIHCYVALVNNRIYGDSRVRGPFKHSWLRDVVRVKGGIDDYFVIAEIDVNDLREFQSHVDSPDGPFKPIPEGFEIEQSRRMTPQTRRSG